VIAAASSPSRLTAERPSKGRLRRDYVMASPPLTQPVGSTGVAGMRKPWGLGSPHRKLTTILTTTATTVAAPTTSPTRRVPAYRAWSRPLPAPGSVAVTWSWLTASPIPQGHTTRREFGELGGTVRRFPRVRMVRESLRDNQIRPYPTEVQVVRAVKGGRLRTCHQKPATTKGQAGAP
jgi:hypothetical protein